MGEERKQVKELTKNMSENISEFTTLLTRKRDEDESAAATAVSDKVADLEHVIESLQIRLQKKTDSLKQQKRSSEEELRKRLEDAEIASELKQRNFDKERDALQELVAEERNKVKALELKLKDSLEKQKNRFDDDDAEEDAFEWKGRESCRTQQLLHRGQQQQRRRHKR